MSFPRKYVLIVFALVLALSSTSIFGLNRISSVAAASYNLTKSGAPVVTADQFASGETVIFDTTAGLYKMWYVQTNPDIGLLGYIRSNLGAELTADLQTRNFTGIADHGDDIRDLLDGLAGLTTGDLHGYLSGVTTTVKYTTSSTGLAWTAPVAVTYTAPTTTWDQFIAAPNVIKDGSTYKMWYTGLVLSETDLHNIFVAMDTMHLTGVQLGTLIADIIAGNLTALQSDLTTMSLRGPAGTIAADTLMFLANSAPAIGYATSTDGTSWTKNAAPVMTDATGWANLGVMTPAVVKTSTDFVMYYSGASVSLGLVDALKAATSVAGFETAMLSDSALAIGRATSTDGVTGWTKDASPILQKGAIGEWDNYGVFAPAVIKNADGTWDMWYTGLKGTLSSVFSYLNGSINLSNLFLTGFNSAIGHATSSDGVTWTKETAANPVLVKGGGSAWDNYGVAFPSAVVNAGYLCMWYTGITADPDAAFTSFFNPAHTVNDIMAAGTGTSSKIGYANFQFPSTDATLSNLAISAGTLTPVFAAGTLTYTDSVVNATSSVMVTPTVTESHATVTVNGTAVASGAASGAISLSVGANTITVVVTAQDTITTKTYTITVTRAAPPTSTTTTTTTSTTTTTTTSTTTPTTTTTTSTTPTTTTTTPTTTTTTTTTSTLPVVITTTIPGSSGTVDVSGTVDQNGKFTKEIVISANEGAVSINIPSGTVALKANGQPLDEISIEQIATPPLNATGFKFLGAFFEIGPTGATFNPPIVITLSYAGITLPQGTTEDDIQIGYIDKDGVFNSLATTIHKNTKTATAETTHFTPYGLLIPDGTPAKMTISDLTITPPQIPVNGKATASVVVTNSGGSTGTYVVDLKIDGAVIESKSVTLPPGESQTVTFEIAGDKVGSYSIAIDNASSTLIVQPAETSSTTPADKTSSLPIVLGIIIGVLLGGVLVFLVIAQVRKPAVFTVSDMVINPLTVRPGEAATITVKVTNTSNKSGTYNAIIFINNNAESSRDVTLAKGASELVSFSIAKNTPAIYNINVEKVNGKLIVKE